MDIEFLKEHNLLEAHKRFQQIMEYTNAGGSGLIDEDGEEDAQMGGQPMPEMGGDVPPVQGDVPPVPNDPSMGMGNAPMPEDPSMGQEMPAPNGVEGFNPQGEQPMLGNTSETDPNEEEEEVIDVDDLTKSMEGTEKKVDALSDKFERVMGMLDSFENQLDASNQRMEDLKREMERRNPTPVEKMSLRAKNSYPFNITPDEYWKDKEETSNYSTEDDKNGEDEPQYQITKNDIDNINDWQAISKSMDSDYMSLRDMLDL